MFRKSLIAGLALAMLGTVPAAAKTFTFTAIPDQDESALTKRFGKVADYLSKALGVEVKYIPVKSYAASVTAFRNDQVQLAWFGGLSGVQARALVPGSKAIAQGAADRQFVSYFIAHASTGLQPSDSFPDGIKDKTFTFGSKGSTSGRLMPEFYIRQHFGKGPEEVFSRVGFSGDHERTIALVQAGTYQVGALNYAVWDRDVKEGKIDTSKVRVIWKTPTYPDYNWTIRGDVDKTWGAGFTAKVTKVLLAITDPELLKTFPRKKFIPASNDDYKPVEVVGKKIGILE